MSTTTKHTTLSNGATYVKTIQEKDIQNGNNGVSVSSSDLGQSGKTPLQPKSVSATYRNGEIIVDMTVYVDVDDNITSFGIYEKPTIDIPGNRAMLTTKPIYIVYDCPEYSTGLLYEYSFNFTISDPEGTIDFIESYLFDKDPVTSRGTKTTVKREMI